MMAIAMLCAGCSTTRHVPDDSYLLDKVNIRINDSEDVPTDELYNFLRQRPNHKIFGFAKLQLSTYSLSGRDSTKWWNRWLRRLGEAPVIYDEDLTEASQRQLHQALVNRGYLDARVEVDTISKTKRMRVSYNIHAGKPHRITSLAYDIPDHAIHAIVMTDTAKSVIRPGDLFDRTNLDNERTRITAQLRNAGYYDFNREYITFSADTIAGNKKLGLTLRLNIPSALPTSVSGDSSNTDKVRHHLRYIVRKVFFVFDADATTLSERRHEKVRDTVDYRQLTIIYGKDHYIKPSTLDECCYITPGVPYSAVSVDRTYQALGRLSILKFVNIELKHYGSTDDRAMLDAYIYLSRNKKQSAAVELEGTNSEGDLGFGLGLTYQHRNLARGSELLTTKLRASYESLSGNLDGLINKRYSEYAAETGITFPQFKCPFLSKSFKQRILASTEFAVSFNYQERPEYTRIIAGAAWKWKWQQQRIADLRRHTYDLIDINYVRLPQSTIDFIDQIAPSNPLLRYSYEDHFIMRMGYTYYHSNRRLANVTGSGGFSLQPYVTTLRVSAETAGNLLYAFSSAVGQHRSDNVYKILGIQYAQYVKGEVDYTYTRNFDRRNALSFHVGAGIAYPYGNSSMVPFEKRFYAGGANGVRGWGVRTLGPGSYDARNSVTDFINQCGDIRLDLSLEYRAKLFWVLEGAVFIDAGNIWTVHDYENQPGGMFRFDTFYKQIAAAYGIGLRMDFTYFLLRFDLGFKAHNPAMNQEEWPLIHPKWSRDANFHFSVGYPF